MANNTGRVELSDDQLNPEPVANTSDGRLDGKLTDVHVSDFTGGDVTLTADQFQIHATVQCTNVSVARDLILPNEVGRLIVDNTAGIAAVSAKRGTGTIIVAIGDVNEIYLNGAVNDIDLVSGGAGGGGDVQEAVQRSWMGI